MVINPTYISVPDFGASADIVQPDTPAPYVDGYLPNQQWPAQHANFFLNGLTTNLNDAVDTVSATVVEINNVLSAAGITPSSSVTNQLLQSIQQSSGGLLWRQDCRVATTANITLSGAQTIDGISVVAGDRVLVKNQSTGADNGVYLCAAGAWTRAVDLDSSAEMVNGVAVRVLVGTANASTAWVLNTGGTITLGSTALVFQASPLPGLNIIVPTALTYMSSIISKDTQFQLDSLTGILDISAGASAKGIRATFVVSGLAYSSAGVTLTFSATLQAYTLFNGTYVFIWNGTQWVWQSAPPIGELAQFAGRSLPTGFVIADGSALSRTAYADLFNYLNPNLGTMTVTIASPGVVTLSGHGFITGDSLYITTTGALPTGLTANTLYYVIFVSSSTFQLATSYANALASTAINTTGSQSGVHTIFACPFGLGNGSTTFNVPAMMAASPRGKGTSTAFTQNETVQLGLVQNDQMQGHYHSAQGTAVGGLNILTSTAARALNGVAETSPVTGPLTDGTNGTPRTGNETRGKSIVVNYGIRY